MYLNLGLIGAIAPIWFLDDGRSPYLNTMCNRWIARCVRGMEDDDVRPKSMPKSMMAAKTFEKTNDISSVEQWAGILAEELADRIKRDGAMYNRKPRNLVLHYK